MNREEIAFLQETNNLEDLSQDTCNIQDLKFKTLIKESHGAPVVSLKFHQLDAEYENLVATVGGNQATVYDDSYLGEYINVVLQFTNKPTSETKGGGLCCCAWIVDTDEENNLPYLVVAGQDPNLSVISIAASSVVALLKGHQEIVKQLEYLEFKDSRKGVASLDVAGTLKVWNVFEGNCLLTTDVSASSMMWSPVRESLLTPKYEHIMEHVFIEDRSSLQIKSKESPIPLSKKPESNIESLFHLNDERFALCTLSGSIHIYPYNFNLDHPGLSSLSIHSACSAEPTCFCVSMDGSKLVLGGSHGQVEIYDTSHGTKLGCLSVPGRFTGPVHACAVSPNALHVLISVGHGHICRFQPIFAS